MWGGRVTPAHKKGRGGILVRACARDGRCHSFSERGKLGPPSHKKEVCVVQQKESVSNFSGTLFFFQLTEFYVERG